MTTAASNIFFPVRNCITSGPIISIVIGDVNNFYSVFSAYNLFSYYIVGKMNPVYHK